MKKKKKAFLLGSALATIVLCASLIAGATFALFTSSDSVNISVTSGSVNVTASIKEDTVELYSPASVGLDGVIADKTNKATAAAFANGGTAEVDENGDIDIKNMTPGDKVSFEVAVKNNSNVQIKYRSSWTAVENSQMLDDLTVTVNGVAYDGSNGKTLWATWELSEARENTVYVSVEMNTAAVKQYTGECKLTYAVEAVQGNAKVVNDAIPATMHIANVQEFKAFAEAAGGASFKNKTVELDADIDLSGEAWTPIVSFNGTFKGNGHKISNIKVASGTYAAVGLFGELAGNIENLTVENFTAEDVTVSTGVGALVGNAVTGSVISGVTVNNVTVSANRRVGGVAGFSYAKRIENCAVDNADLSAACELVDGKYDNGDKVGVIVGFTATDWSAPSDGYIDNCQASNSVIRGYRDLGGITGYGDASRITECTVTDVTVYQDLVTQNPEEYSAEKGATYIGAIIGRSPVALNEGNKAYGVSFVQETEETLGLVKYGDSYTIYTKDGFARWYEIISANHSELYAKTHTIAADIDADGFAWERLWLGSDTDGFVLNGLNHTISNFSIVRGESGYFCVGLFNGVLGGENDRPAEIKNVTFDNVTVTENELNVGVVIGHTYSSVNLENVHVVNSSLTAQYKVAALVGTVYDEKEYCNTVVNLKDCTVENTTVKCTKFDFFTCGLVAWVNWKNGESVTFENCELKGCTLNIAAENQGYDLHYWGYAHGVDPDNGVDIPEGVTVDADCKVIGA